VCLSSTLPYVANAYLSQRIRYQDSLQERQRVSRELHDGVIQTISALRWQVQVLRRHLESMSLELAEITELEKLAEKAQQEARDSLDILRSHSSEGGLIPNLTEFVNQLRDRYS
jgi:signal transduction histidine kinase